MGIALGDGLVENIVEAIDRKDLARLFVDRTRDRHFKFVVVPVTVRVCTLAKDLVILRT